MSDPIGLSYGKGHLNVRLPDDARATVIRKAPLPRIDDPRDAVRHAFDYPIGAEPLKALARGKRSACIVICDITRPVPNHLFLRPMIEDMIAAGIPAEGICVLIATGLHRPNEGAELEELVGDPWVTEHVKVLNHFARNDAEHIDLGFTSTRRTPVKLDRSLVEAELKIVTGLVEPHFMAGYSGGRKVIAPGVAHADTIRTFHNASFMEHPLARACSLEGNPLHEEQLEIVRMLGEIYALNTVIDEDRALVRVTFGEVIASHMTAVDFVRGSTEINVPRRFRTVVTSCAGYPLDKTYYQTVKGMVTPLDILEPGGTLIIASECSEGLGSPEFRECQERLVRLGPDAFLQSLLQKKLADIDEWQSEKMLEPVRAGRVKLYSTGLNDEERRLTGVDVVDSVERAIGESLARSGDRDVAVIPEGPYVVPFCR
jgi:nickel-dependent lactate racemase